VWRFFESHLYTLADMFCGTKQVIDEHLITCSFLSYAESQNPAEKECCFGLHSSKKRMVLTDFGFVYLHL
jgi:hypothetical protein